MDTKVTTVIVNATKQGLTIKVGNRHCYAKLTSVKEGREYRMQIDVNWTYQEFLVQNKSDAKNQLLLNSDDCCDYERITIKELTDGGLDMDTQLRHRFRSEPCSAIQEEDNAALTHSKPNVASRWKSWLVKFL